MIYEIEIYSFPNQKFNEDLEKSWSLIIELYSKVLSKDSNWHFFYEETYTVFRFSKKYKRNVENFLLYNGMIYSKPIKWIDSNRIVEQYKEEYTKLFHIFSTLAILVPHQDMNRVFDRIVHSFCNHSHYKMADPLNPRDPYWEQEFIAKNALDRATYNGYRIGLAIGNKQ